MRGVLDVQIQVEMLWEGGIRPARRLVRRRALKREHRAVADLPAITTRSGESSSVSGIPSNSP